MPSLVPKTKIIDPPADLEEIFSAERYAQSLTRVMNYIRHFEMGFSKRPEDALRRPDVITERFVIDMPTQEAYLAEIELLASIKAHSTGELTDDQLKAVCDGYVAAHIACHQGGKTPWAKVGDYSFWTWKAVPLFYVNFSIFDGWTCNAIQALILSQIYSDREMMVTRL